MTVTRPMTFTANEKKRAEQLIAQGYRRTSRKHGIVSRIDRPDWREHMAQQHAPWDPIKTGLNWVNLLDKNKTYPSSPDHYRCVYSKDHLEIGRLARLVPASGFDPVEYVPLPKDKT